MSIVNQKYLKDESGNIITPVVSTESVFDKNEVSMDTIAYKRHHMYLNTTLTGGYWKAIRNYVVTGNEYIQNIDDYENEGFEAGFTIIKAGVYVVTCYLSCYCQGSKDRIFNTLVIGNNNSTDGLCKTSFLRGWDGRSLGNGHTSLRDTWLVNLQVGAYLRFDVYSSQANTLYGYSNSSDTHNYHTATNIVRVCDLPL